MAAGFAGLAFANPWGLLGLLTLPAIVWLYRYTRQGRMRSVSCVALWAQSSTAGEEGRKPQRPPFSLALLLSLLAALLLSLALADLRWSGDLARVERVGLVIDNSASMSAGQAWNQTREQFGKLAERHPDAWFTVVVSGPRPSRLAGTDLAADQLLPAFDQVRARSTHHDLRPAIDLLRSLLPAEAPFLIFSDQLEAAALREDEQAALIHVGLRRDNVGFAGMDWPEGQAPFVVVRAWGAADAPLPHSVRIAWSQDGEPQTPLVFPLGRAERLVSLPVSDSARRVDLHLTSADGASAGNGLENGLALDDRAVLIRPPLRRLNVDAIELSRALTDSTNRLIAALPEWHRDPAELPDLLIVADDKPVADLGAVAVLEWRLPDARAQLQSDLVVDSFSPLMDGVDLNGLVWLASNRSVAEPGAQVLLRSASSDLVWLLPSPSRPRLVINADARNSNLLRHPFWPVLAQNWSQALLAARGGWSRFSFQQGERLSLTLPGDWPRPLRVGSRDYPGDRAGSRVDIGRLDEAGVFAWSAGRPVTAGDQADELAGELAVNFVDLRESDLQQRARPAGSRATGLPTLKPHRDHVDQADTGLAGLLVFCAVLALLAVWLLIGRQAKAGRR